MSQKSITSFFTRTTSTTNGKKKNDSLLTSPNKSNKTNEEIDSPIKTYTRKKRVRIESTSSEDDLSNEPEKNSSIKNEISELNSSTNSNKSDELNHDNKKNTSNKSPKGSKNKKRKINKSSSDSSEGEDEKKKSSVKPNGSNANTDTEKSENIFSKKLKTYSNKNKKKSNDKNSIKLNDESEKKIISPVNKSPKKEDIDNDDNDDINNDNNKELEKEKTTNKNDKSPKTKKTSISSFFAPQKNKCDELDKSNTNAKNVYNPQESKYHPIKDACWKEGEKVPFLALARTLEEIENVSARLKMIEILSNYLRSVIVLSPQDLIPSIYLCLNKLGPAYLGLELGIAEMSLMKALAQSFGRSLAQVRAEAASTGDLGLVAEQSRSSQRMMFQPAPLTVRLVFDRLTEIAKLTGNASQTKKMDKIQSTLVACRNSEARYLIRLLAGKLRIGLAEQSILQAISLACTLTPPNQSRPFEQLDASKGIASDTFKSKYDANTLLIKTHYCECPNYDRIMPVILEHGVSALPEYCRLEPGLPLKPMLAHPTKGVQEVLQRFEGQTFTCEWKYDGERAQIHYLENGSVKIYSRNQEDNTSKYPDIINRIKNAISDDVKSFIIDCEAVAWDRETKQILPFQILSTRKRKDADESSIKVQVCVYMFDLLYFNGISLIRDPLLKRRELLRKNFKVIDDEWAFATSIDATGMDEVQEFLDDAVKNKCEGLMVKTLEQDATYEIAKRSRNWLKLKKDYLEGVGDTLDLVVIGGYLGKGKRTGLYGGFLLACYDNENEEFQSICKIGTGFSDESLQKHSEFFRDNLIEKPKPYYRFDSSHEPDHWFEACQVWEVKCADLSLSPVHRAALGIVDSEKGISLRFPRFLKIREDKTIEQATSSAQVASMYENQDQIKNQNQPSSRSIEEEFY